MNANEINVFIENMENLIDTLFNYKTTRSSLSLNSGEIASTALNLTLTLSEPLKGYIVVIFPPETAAGAGSLLMGEDMSPEDPSLTEVMSEIGNMLVGNSRTAMKEVVGAEIEITLSNVQKGGSLPADQEKWIQAEFDCELGPFKLLASV